MAFAHVQSRLLEVRLFGEPRFYVDGALQRISIPPKAILLLCVLALKAGQALDRTKLAYTLWPDDAEDEAKGKLRRHLHLLARALTEGERGSQIVATNATLTWKADGPCSIDVVEFERLSRAGDDLERAVGLYAGDLLPNFYEDWLDSPRRRLRDMQLQNLLTLAERSAQCDDFAKMLEYARAALRIDPWREDAIRHVVRARTRLGDRSGAMQEYSEFVTRLRDEFGTEPLTETKQAFEAIKAAEPLSTNLPLETTTFVGREAQLQMLKTLLQTSRMVTIAGPGGVGKSRMAQHCARDNLSSYPDGVWLVQGCLDCTQEQLVHTIAASMHLLDMSHGRNIEALSQYLRGKMMLLLFDNVEGFLEVCAIVSSALLASCEGLSILATSREPLSIAGETVIRLAPFDQDDEAITLFCDRARSADASFAPTAQARRAIAEVCRRLDRLPLAIELAAARVPTIAPEEILERLQDRFALLKRARAPEVHHHQTLHATIEWSQELLSTDEKTLFRRLAIFPTAFTLNSSEQICSDTTLAKPSVFDILARLVDKSLVTAALASDGRRYRFLDSIREFALEQLYESGDAEPLWDRYVAYYKVLAERNDGALNGPHQQDALNVLQAELDNLRTAMQLGEIDRRHSADSLDIACDLQQFWLIRGYFEEGRRWLEQTLAAAHEAISPTKRASALSALAVFCCFSDDLNAAERYEREALNVRSLIDDGPGIAESLHVLGGIAYDRGDAKAAHDFWLKCLELVRRNGDTQQVAKTLDNLGMTYADLGDYENARRSLNESLNAYKAIGDTYGLAWVIAHQAGLARRLRDYEQAVRLYDESLALRERLHDRHGIASCLHYLSGCYAALGDFTDALDYANRSIRTWYELRYKIWLADSFENMAHIESARSRFDRAALLLGAAEHLRNVTSKPLPHYQREHHDAVVAAAMNALGETAFEEKQRIGANLSLDEMVAFAIDQPS